jgi:hypothetical protein
MLLGPRSNSINVFCIPLFLQRQNGIAKQADIHNTFYKSSKSHANSPVLPKVPNEQKLAG